MKKLNENKEKNFKVVVFSGILFSLLTILGLILALNKNLELFFIINRLSCYTGVEIWAFTNLLGDGLITMVLLTPLLRRYPQHIMGAFAGLIICTVIVQVLKGSFDIYRPAKVIAPDLINIIGSAYKRHSFPSGHSATIMLTATIYILASNKVVKQISVFFLAVIIGVSRIVAGVHWPIDVVIGLMIGTVSALLGFQIMKSFQFSYYRKTQQILYIIFFSGIFISNSLSMSNCVTVTQLKQILTIGLMVIVVRDYMTLLKTGIFKQVTLRR